MLSIRFFRRVFCALIPVAIAGCSAGTPVPKAFVAQDISAVGAPAGIASFRPAPSAVTEASSYCDIKSFWYFRGSCDGFYLNAKGQTATLKAYKGLTLAVSFSKSNAPSKSAFLIGDGTSDKDITGTVNGQPFPLYGSIPCLSVSGSTVPCKGTGVLYALLGNASSSSITFATYPAFKVSAKSFPSKTCSEMLLLATKKSYAWGILPGSARVSAGSITFPGINQKATFKGFTIGLFGFSC